MANCNLGRYCGHSPEGCMFTQYVGYGDGTLSGKYIALVRDQKCPMPVEIVISNLRE